MPIGRSEGEARVARAAWGAVWGAQSGRGCRPKRAASHQQARPREVARWPGAQPACTRPAGRCRRGGQGAASSASAARVTTRISASSCEMLSTAGSVRSARSGRPRSRSRLVEAGGDSAALARRRADGGCHGTLPSCSGGALGGVGAARGPRRLRAGGWGGGVEPDGRPLTPAVPPPARRGARPRRRLAVAARVAVAVRAP